MLFRSEVSEFQLKETLALPHTFLFGKQWYVERVDSVNGPEDCLADSEYEGTIRLANVKTKLYLSPASAEEVRTYKYLATKIRRDQPDGYFRATFYCSQRNICGF